MNFDKMLTAIHESMKSTPPTNLSPEASAVVNQIKELHAELVSNNGIQFTIFGEFNAGKSTLLNALLGAAISPTSILPTNAINLYVEYGKTPTATVVKRNAEGRLAEETIAIDAISDQAKLHFSRNGMIAPDGVEAIKIKWPMTVLQKQGVIVDTPGLADAQERSQITRSEIRKTDVALCVLRFEKLLNEDELSFVQELATHVNGNIAFIINIKGTPEQEQMTETLHYARTMLRQIRSQLWEETVLFPINARIAFEDRLAQKLDGAGALALSALEKWIDNVLSPEFSAKIRLTSRMKRFQQYLEQFEGTLKQDIEQ